MSEEQLKPKPFQLDKVPHNWRELMSREVKRYRNRWNTEVVPFVKKKK